MFSSSDPSGPARIAILPVENLSGDVSLDWMATAAPALINSQLEPTDVASGLVANAGEGYRANANQFLHVYFELRDEVPHWQASRESADSHEVVDRLSIDGPVTEAADAIARWISSAAAAPPTDNAAAVRAWATGDPETAVAQDPAFGKAWLDLARAQIGNGQQQAALLTVENALSQTLSSSLDETRLELLHASLTGDRQAEMAGVESLAEALPNDLTILRQAAELSMQRRAFDRAVVHYRRLSELVPAEPAFLNQLGYALYFSGDLAGGRQVLDRYAEAENQRANALDSQGEILFMAGEFAEAERYFLEADTANPALLDGGDVLKAAYARWLSGDAAGAAELFGQYTGGRAIVGDATLPWREAAWEYLTGSPEQAIAQLTQVAAVTPQNQQETALNLLARQQLAVWNNADAALPQGLDARRQAYENSSAFSDGLVRTLYAEALLEAGDRDTALALAERWPLPGAGEAVLEAYTFRRYLDLRERLGLPLP